MSSTHTVCRRIAVYDYMLRQEWLRFLLANAAAGTVAFTDVFVVHSGSDHSQEGRQRKLERDFRILALDLAERPDHPFVLFNLGMTHADAEQYDEAITHLQRSIEVSQPEESHLRKAYALLVSALSQANRHEESWETCRRGLELFADDRELLFRSGMLLQHFGRQQEAEAAYRLVLNGSAGRHFQSVDRVVGGFVPRDDFHVFSKGEKRKKNKGQQEKGFADHWIGSCDSGPVGVIAKGNWKQT